jgi:hypothetical protein
VSQAQQAQPRGAADQHRGHLHIDWPATESIGEGAFEGYLGLLLAQVE